MTDPILVSMIVILGKSGQLGRALQALLSGSAAALGHDEVNITDAAALNAALTRLQPEAVVNAAAYTAVDKAERDADAAFAVNARAPLYAAEYCAHEGIPLVHFSTDYVFSGEGSRPWTEEDPPAPLSLYGRSKLDGENAIRRRGGKHLIFRTSWLYDANGRNFLNTMLALGRTREEVKVVADQHGAPTYAPQLAQAAMAGLTAAMAQKEFPSGVYHLCHGGETTWHGFAEAIFAAAGRREALNVRKVTAIPSEAYPTPARRPHNSRLDCSKARKTLGILLPAWQEGLAACMEQKYGSAGHAAAGS